jgi:hypothetical protein
MPPPRSVVCVGCAVVVVADTRADSTAAPPVRSRGKYPVLSSTALFNARQAKGEQICLFCNPFFTSALKIMGEFSIYSCHKKSQELKKNVPLFAVLNEKGE